MKKLLAATVLMGLSGAGYAPPSLANASIANVPEFANCPVAKGTWWNARRTKYASGQNIAMEVRNGRLFIAIDMGSSNSQLGAFVEAQSVERTSDGQVVVTASKGNKYRMQKNADMFTGTTDLGSGTNNLELKCQ